MAAAIDLVDQWVAFFGLGQQASVLDLGQGGLLPYTLQLGQQSRHAMRPGRRPVLLLFQGRRAARGEEAKPGDEQVVDRDHPAAGGVLPGAR
ncbi:hypothetical protein [Streptomyces sp. NPDC060322]|uniref:hypothetical protein n=1 Tax=Streptomyces sp. NPDC060322 TaxID=3347097 RepID=UPI003663EDF6